MVFVKHIYTMNLFINNIEYIKLANKIIPGFGMTKSVDKIITALELQ